MDSIAPAPSIPRDFTILDLIDGLGGPTAFARVCGFDKHAHARGGDMRRRQSFSVKYWARVIEAARRAGYSHVNYETIALAHQRPKAKKRKGESKS